MQRENKMTCIMFDYIYDFYIYDFFPFQYFTHKGKYMGYNVKFCGKIIGNVLNL